jgi:hypothetical protein
MTGGWAATNTLSEALHDGLEYFGHELDDVTGAVHAISPQAKKYDAGLDALALVEAALDAAEKRVEYGHNDTCDMELSESEDYPCSCGHDALAAALRAVREGR